MIKSWYFLGKRMSSCEDISPARYLALKNRKEFYCDLASVTICDFAESEEISLSVYPYEGYNFRDL